MDILHSQSFSKHVQELMSQHHVPGLAIALVQDEQTSSIAFGEASREPPRPCTPDTLFDIASASKSLTAASVALLVVDNQNHPEVQWEAPMSSLLPDDFVMHNREHTDSVTVEDILSHRTGLPSHDNSYLGPRAAQPDDARSVTRNLRNLPVAAPVRTKYFYCNMLFTVATHLIEQMTGKSFADFLDERFFKPLYMNSTTLQPSRARQKGLSDRLATGYTWREEQETFQRVDSVECPEGQGAGSILTSVNDYILYVKAMLHRAYPITNEIYAGLVKSRTLVNPGYEQLDPYTSPAAYAAGWEVYYYRGHQIVRHDGLVDGFGSTHFFLPELRFGGVIFGNSDGMESVGTIIAHELIDEALGVPSLQRPDWVALEADRTAQDDVAEAEQLEELKQQLDSGSTESRVQHTPLVAYTGTYSNAGYHDLTVEIRDGGLFVDATDRSMAFSLAFEHVRDQIVYLAHLCDFQVGGGRDESFGAEFQFKDGMAVRMGLRLEADLPTYIWFTRL